MRKGSKKGVRISDLSKKARAQLDAMPIGAQARKTLDGMRRLSAVRRVRPLNKAEEQFAQQWREGTIRFHLSREVQFDHERKWRFDFAIWQFKIAVEIEGVTHAGGRHQRPKGFIEDCRKYNKAAELGWTVLRYTPAQVRKGEALDQVFRVVHQRYWDEENRERLALTGRGFLQR